MKLYNLDKIPWEESQLIYHALAELGREALCLVSPQTPYVCIGFHQDAPQEVDLEYCCAHSIPVFRRDLGGGAVYLDGEQLFFQLILHKDNPRVPKRRPVFYQKFLRPIINTYIRIGIPAQYRPVNDVITDTRKISGTGAGEIGECIVFVGNLIVDFDYETMARVLKVPDEKFRDKVHQTLRNNLSTIRRELGGRAAEQWTEYRLNALMAEEFQKLLPPLVPSQKDPELTDKIDELKARMLTQEWLFQKSRKRRPGREVKVSAGTNVLHRIHKAEGGLIRTDFELSEGRYGNVSISGDFFCFPEEAVAWLENELEGKTIDMSRSILDRFYSEQKADTPGIKPDDWMQVLGV
ncbi:MAG: biotin/lipoate A/B protein ligase family protein [Desulfatiglandaceae bacterium]